MKHLSINRLPLALSLGGGLLAAAGAAMAAPAAGTLTAPATGAASAPYRLPDVVANVNGAPITRAEVDTELERNYGQQVVFALVMDKLLDQKAQQLGIVPTAAEITQAYQEADQQSQGRMAMILQNNNMSRTEFENQVLRPKLELQALERQGVAVTDAEIQQYYNQHKAEWTSPPQVELYRLHTPTLDVANQARAALAAGKPWESVFKQYSDDKPYYKSTGGYYGTVVRSVLPPEVTEAITGLQPAGLTQAGGLSKPMAIQDEGPDHGYVIWKLTKVVTGAAPGLADRRSEIQRILQQQKAKSEGQVISDLVKSARITDLPPGYQEVFDRFANPTPAPPMPTPPGGGAPPPPPPLQ